MTGPRTSPTVHPLTALTAGDRLRVSWFRTRLVTGPTDGQQVWVLEALTAMADQPVAFAVYDFSGTFPADGTEAANRQVLEAGFEPAAPWHLAHDTTTWVLDSLRPTTATNASPVPREGRLEEGLS